MFNNEVEIHENRNVREVVDLAIELAEDRLLPDVPAELSGRSWREQYRDAG